MIEPKKIMLLKHPVSADQKAEARSLGVLIVDIRFKDQFAPDELYKKPKAKKAEENKD